jgi:hypothetical protein
MLEKGYTGVDFQDEYNIVEKQAFNNASAFKYAVSSIKFTNIKKLED